MYANILSIQTIYFQFIVLFTLTRDCSSCRNIVPHVRSLKVNTLKRKNPFYFVDCEKEQELCTKQNVSGYPSIISYFTYNTKEAEKCGISLPSFRVIPYHGHINTDKLMEWFDDISDQGIHYGSPHSFHDRCNIHLLVESEDGSVGQLLTACIKLMCQQLSYIECFISTFQSKYVSSLQLIRKDGISSEIYNKNKSLSQTFTGDPGLHLFHEIEEVEDVSCEEEPSDCVRMLSEFIQSHSRLLLTELTPFLFHTPLSYNALFSNLPILVVLTDDDGMSSTFFSQIRVCLTFYRKKMLFYVLQISIFRYFINIFVNCAINMQISQI